MSGTDSRINTASSSIVSSTISLIAKSRRRLPECVPVAATVTKAQVTYLVDALVAVEAWSFLVVYQLSLVGLLLLDDSFCSNLPLGVFFWF